MDAVGRLTVNTAAWTEPGATWPQHRGIECMQFRSDMDRYAEIAGALDPPFIIEIGRALGGTALFLADLDPPRTIISIDVNPPPDGLAAMAPGNLKLLTGSSTRLSTLLDVDELTGRRRGLVLLDGDHDAVQVQTELDFYAELADYLVVEDTILRDLHGTTNGPHIALDRWLPRHREWTVDVDPIPTQHPGGWLRRTEEATP